MSLQEGILIFGSLFVGVPLFTLVISYLILRPRKPWHEPTPKEREEGQKQLMAMSMFMAAGGILSNRDHFD